MYFYSKTVISFDDVPVLTKGYFFNNNPPSNVKVIKFFLYYCHTTGFYEFTRNLYVQIRENI